MNWGMCSQSKIVSFRKEGVLSHRGNTQYVLKVGVLLMHGPGLLDEVLPSGTLSDNWTTFCWVPLGDGIWDGGTHAPWSLSRGVGNEV